MARSEAVRKEVLRLDGNRCQITGARGDEVPLQVHHWHPLGIGGSKVRDTVENGITLATRIHLDGLHPGVSVPTVRIVKWDRADKEDGLVVERRSGVGEPWEKWPKEELWFYQRQEHLEQVEARIQGLSAIERDVARDLWELSEGYSLLDPDAVSFAQYAAARGWSSNKATKAARAYEWVQEHALTWPQGVTAEKVNILRLANPDNGQAWLEGAVDQSISDLKRLLVEAGLRTATMRWYLLIDEKHLPLGRTHTDTLFVRSRDYEIVMARMRHGVKVVEINAFKTGIKWDRKAQKLYDHAGREIRYETWEKEEE